jgi:hypothetical protein
VKDGEEQMKNNHKYTWHDRIREFLYSNRNTFRIVSIVLTAIILSYILDKGNTMVIVITLGACLLILVIVCLVKKQLLFYEDEMAVETRLCGKRIKRAVYGYKDIYKFILAMDYRIIPFKKYSFYIDWADKITKIQSEQYYYDCIKTIEQIKDKAKKLVYDATDEYYKSEEDMFRNYYKMKQFMDEVKRENSDE